MNKLYIVDVALIPETLSMDDCVGYVIGLPISCFVSEHQSFEVNHENLKERYPDIEIAGPEFFEKVAEWKKKST